MASACGIFQWQCLLVSNSVFVLIVYAMSDMLFYRAILLQFSLNMNHLLYKATSLASSKIRMSCLALINFSHKVLLSQGSCNEALVYFH